MSSIPVHAKKMEAVLLQARESFKWALRSCAYLLNNRVKPDDELYYPLVAATYVLYSRPFLRNYGIGKLEEVLVPKEYLDLHSQILAFRNKVFAHRDLSSSSLSREPGESELHAIYITKKDRWVYTLVAEARIDIETIREIHDLLEVLLKKIRYHSNKFFKRYEKYVPEIEGTYRMNVFDEKLPDFEAANALPVDQSTFTRNIVRRKR